MNRKEMNQFNMIQSVSQFFLINEVHISSNPAIVTAVEKLKTYIDSIGSEVKVQAIDTKIDTELKKEDKQKIVDAALNVIAGMAALAATNGDTRLKMMADISPTDLSRLRDTDFIVKISEIHEIALPIATELAIWGVAQSDINALQTESYRTKSPGLRNVEAKTIQATTNLKATLDEAKAHLKNILDPMMLPFKRLNATLHGEYLTARVIIDLTAGHTPEKPVV